MYLAIVLLLAIIGPIVLTFRPANTEDSYLQRSLREASSSISDKSATGKRSFSTSTRHNPRVGSVIYLLKYSIITKLCAGMFPTLIIKSIIKVL